MTTLTNCKSHGGPLTVDDIELLDTMTDDQVKYEAAYLKQTYGQGIRYKRKVGNKFVYFTTDELRSQIRDLIKPDCNVTNDISQMVKVALL